ncbi:MAG: PASTA domain-containing protein [Candidatus Delongbacteria bacterium]|nr:PASTA domain-containing protein [Candidatus Delongbacteria bacterium]
MLIDQIKTSSPVSRLTPAHVRNQKILLLLFCLLWSVIIGRLIYLQVIKNGYYEKKADCQALVRKEILPQRGTIYDRHGVALAVDLKCFTFYGVPYKITDIDRVAEVFSRYTGKPLLSIKNQIRKNRNFVYLARRVGEQDAKRIEDLHLDGVYSNPEDIRYYPMNGMASQVIGYTNIDNQGIEGIEYKFDSLLAGEKGYIWAVRDAKGNLYELPNRIIKAPVNGQDIYTTLDLQIQQILEDELIESVRINKAELAIGIIMDVKTNEVLAMANVPLFDPNRFPREVVNENSRNRAITDMYEPGSTFKMIPASAVLEENLVTQDELIFANEGEIRIAGEVIHDPSPYGWMTFKQIIQHSSNIGIIKLAQRLTPNKFFEYIKLFGFDMQTGILLPGEAAGIVRSPDQWSARSLATLSFGQEIAVTPIQLINAYNAIANHGILYEPRILRRIHNPNTGFNREFTKTKLRQIISERNAILAIEALVATVEEGTGTRARLPFIPVAGKTGTAQYVNPKTFSYSPGQTVPNFIGFLPADDPQYSCLIIIKNPKSGSTSGGLTAGPVFKQVFERIYSLPDNQLQRYIVQKKLCLPIHENENQDTASFYIAAYQQGTQVTLPDFKKRSLSEAVILAGKLGLRCVVYGKGLVYDQNPKPASLVKPGKSILLYARDVNYKHYNHRRQSPIYTCEP